MTIYDVINPSSLRECLTSRWREFYVSRTHVWTSYCWAKQTRCLVLCCVVMGRGWPSLNSLQAKHFFSLTTHKTNKQTNKHTEEKPLGSFLKVCTCVWWLTAHLPFSSRITSAAARSSLLFSSLISCTISRAAHLSHVLQSQATNNTASKFSQQTNLWGVRTLFFPLMNEVDSNRAAAATPAARILYPLRRDVATTRRSYASQNHASDPEIEKNERVFVLLFLLRCKKRLTTTTTTTTN